MEEAELLQATPQKDTISVRFGPQNPSCNPVFVTRSKSDDSCPKNNDFLLFRALVPRVLSGSVRTAPRNTSKTNCSKSDDFCPNKADFLLFRALKTDCAASAEWKRPNWSKKHLKKTRLQFFFWPSKPLSVTLKTPGCLCLTNRWC